MSTDTLQAALVELRRPFTPSAVHFKIQKNPKGKGPAIIVAYVDSRLVAERLNSVVGGDWSDEYGPIQVGQGAAFVTCKLTVLGATREDVGWSNGVSQDMSAKAVYSDAFKRAAVKFSIASSLYELPEIKLWPKDLDSWGEGENTKYRLSDTNRQALTASYEKWTQRPEIQARFGKPAESVVIA